MTPVLPHPTAAVTGLTPAERLLYAAGPQAVAAVAGALGVPAGDVAAVLDGLAVKVRRRLAPDRPPPRATSPVTAEAERLRDNGLGWKAIAGELTRRYGLPFTATAVRLRVRRARATAGTW